MIGDYTQIGHNVILATLNHDLTPEHRGTTIPAPIVIGENVLDWRSCDSDSRRNDWK